MHSRGRIVQGGIVTVEAEGEFAVFNHDSVHRMANSRRQAFDAGTAGGEGQLTRGGALVAATLP